MGKAQLFAVHYAGGNCNSFYFLKSYLPDFDVVCIELPGRGMRMKESLLTEYEDAVADIYVQIRNKLKVGRFVLFGHSMGSYLALRAADLLEREGQRPICLIVSGNAGPGIVRKPDHKIIHMMNRDDLKEELKTLGGAPPEFFSNDELFGFHEPILRADLKLIENYNLMNEPVVNTPIVALMGDSEDEVSNISNWSNYTKNIFHSKILPGGHFFMSQDPKLFASTIKEIYVDNLQYLHTT